MRYRTLGTTGLQVSELGLGSAMLGAASGGNREDGVRVIHRGLDSGINLVDTADVYSNGEAEEIVGAALNFNRAFDDLLTKIYWGEVWSRPGLDVRTRRLLNIGMLIAINHLDGLAVHVRGALRDGVSVETLQEVLLQAAVCVGVPAANSARFAINRVVVEESERGS